MSFAKYAIYDIPDSEALVHIKATSDIVVYVYADQYESEQEQLLTKILGAAQKDINKIQVVKCERSVTYSIRSQEELLVLSFGVPSQSLSLQLDRRPYALQRLEQTTYLFGIALTEMAQSKQDKGALWASLKSYFKIN